MLLFLRAFLPFYAATAAYGVLVLFPNARLFPETMAFCFSGGTVCPTDRCVSNRRPVGFRSKGTMTNLPRDENRTPGKASAKERVRGQGPGAVGSASLAPLRPGAERECVRDPRTRTPRPQEHRCRRCGIERVISPAPLFAPTLPPATMKIGQEP